TAMNGLPDLQSAYPEGEEGTTEAGTGEAPSAEGAETPEIPGTDSPGGEQPSDDMVLPSWDDDNPYGGEGGVNARNVGVEEWDGPGGNQNDNLESIISSNLGIDPSKLYEQLPDGGTLLDKVAEANGIEDPNTIQAGQDLVIPTMDEVPPEQLQERAITGANSADESYSQMNEQIDGLGLDEQQSAQLQESQYNQSFQGALADNPEMKQKVDEVFAMQNGPEKTEALAQLQDQVNNWRNENPFMAQQSDALGAAEWATGQANEQGEIPENIMGMVDTASQVSGNVSDAVSSVAGLSNTDPSVAGDLLQDINQWTTEGQQVKPFDLPSARRPAA
ncbi:MAG: LysM peptidoglycan-binding domain-containing protein, partial [Candidatus Eremiobacteraeota bacterium]|nr:LysM peptidoglycan-binding domain-containing protein [Candidatus Eremiobacteraeota bacterium]